MWIQSIKDLRDGGLTWWHVAKDFITRRISSLKGQAHPMWEYTGGRRFDYGLRGRYVYNQFISLIFYSSIFVDYILSFVDLSQKEIDAQAPKYRGGSLDPGGRLQ